MKKLLILLLTTLPTFIFSQDLYDLNRIPEIRVTFESEHWANKLHKLKVEGEKERMEATVSIDGQELKQVGVRYKGNSSYFSTQKANKSKLPFNMKADYKINGQTFPGGFGSLKLSNVFRDPSFVREALSYEIAREYVPAPRCNFVKLYVNDQYLGLYNNTESIDEEFLNRTFSDKGKDVFIKCDPEWSELPPNTCPEGDKASLMYLGEDPICYKGLYEMKKGGKTGWKQLIKLTKVLNETPDSIGNYMNVEAALWMHAFNNVLVNLDSYTGRLSHNYYLYRTPDGLFTPLIWDLNLSFGGFQYDGIKKGALTTEELQRLSPFIQYKTQNEKRPLIIQLLKNSFYRKMYVGYMHTIMEDWLVSGKYLKRAKEIQAMIDVQVLADDNKLYPYETFKKNMDKTVSVGLTKIVGIEELMEKRTEYLSAHPLMGEVPFIEKVSTLKSGDEIGIQAKVAGEEKVYLKYRKDANEPFKMVEMFDDGGHFDEVGDDKIYGELIPYVKGTQYYVIVEGGRMTKVSQMEANFQYLEVQ
ncbi:MAG: hypothetical protein ACI9XO_001751 [Paraglaciecola sp.]|jgi:hypothetical protein